MKLKKTKIAVYILMFMVLVGCKQNNYIDDYADYLELNFPDDLELLHMEQLSDFQDYSNFSIYRLSRIQRDQIIEQISSQLCNSEKNEINCWKKSDNFYTFKISDSTRQSGYYLEAILTGENDINTLTIYEVQL